jgi:hypothetical protein
MLNDSRNDCSKWLSCGFGVRVHVIQIDSRNDGSKWMSMTWLFYGRPNLLVHDVEVGGAGHGQVVRL